MLDDYPIMKRRIRHQGEMIGPQRPVSHPAFLSWACAGAASRAVSSGEKQ